MSDDIKGLSAEDVEQELVAIEGQPDEAPADSGNDSDAPLSDETTEVKDSDTGDEQEENNDVDFDFRKTPTSIQNLVSKFESLSPEERMEKANNLSRQTEIDAVKEAFPDAFETEEAVSDEKLDQLLSRIDELEKLNGLEKATELLEKIESKRPQLEQRIRNDMLKEQFGDNFKEVTTDPKFIAAYDKYADLELEDRLEIACTLSPKARELSLSGAKEKAELARVVRTPKSGNTPKQEVKERSPREMLSSKTINDEIEAIERKLAGK